MNVNFLPQKSTSEWAPNPRQAALITLMCAPPFPKMATAARDLGLKEQTARKWMLDPRFRAALEAAEQEAAAELRSTLQRKIRAMGEAAVAVKAMNLRSQDPSIRLRESTWILERLLGREPGIQLEAEAGADRFVLRLNLDPPAGARDD